MVLVPIVQFCISEPNISESQKFSKTKTVSFYLWVFCHWSNSRNKLFPLLKCIVTQFNWKKSEKRCYCSKLIEVHPEVLKSWNKDIKNLHFTPILTTYENMTWNIPAFWYITSLASLDLEPSRAPWSPLLKYKNVAC